MRLFLPLLLLSTALLQAADRPNVLWIVVEDQSDHYEPFRETLAKTPNVSRLAREGVKFDQAFVTAPVCSPSRSALVTGMYQTTIGAHNHRSSRSEAAAIRLPERVELVPQMLKDAGYYVTNGTPVEPGSMKLRQGKTDYNFVYPDDLYDGADWAGRAEGQPFFAQVQLRGGKLRDQQTLEKRANVHARGVDPAAVELPPYYPDHPTLRKDWAQYLESIEHVDYEVGQLLDRLEREGALEQTAVFFFTDHGVSHARGKQFLYEEGIKIPLVVSGPGLPEDETREDLVAHIDVAATTLYLAGLSVPEWMEARPLFGPQAEPREYVVSARDRCDETVEQLRSVRTDRFKYIRNGYPERPHMQPNRYKDHKAVVRALRELHAAGKLHADQDRIFETPRPREELYDLEKDPHELRNLASDSDHRDELERLRGILDGWIERTGDKGQQPESPAAYEAEMSVYLENSPHPEELERNIEMMKRWAEKGK